MVRKTAKGNGFFGKFFKFIKILPDPAVLFVYRVFPVRILPA